MWYRSPKSGTLFRVHLVDKLKLLLLSCGKKDGLIRVSQGVHAYLKEKDVPHVWHVDEHAHDFQHWKKGLYNFSQLIFKPTTK